MPKLVSMCYINSNNLSMVHSSIKENVPPPALQTALWGLRASTCVTWQCVVGLTP